MKYLQYSDGDPLDKSNGGSGDEIVSLSKQMMSRTCVVRYQPCLGFVSGERCVFFLNPRFNTFM